MTQPSPSPMPDKVIIAKNPWGELYVVNGKPVGIDSPTEYTRTPGSDGVGDVAELVKALEYYSTPATWMKRQGSGNTVYDAPIHDDRGGVAYTALKKFKAAQQAPTPEPVEEILKLLKIHHEVRKQFDRRYLLQPLGIDTEAALSQTKKE